MIASDIIVIVLLSKGEVNLEVHAVNLHVFTTLLWGNVCHSSKNIHFGISLPIVFFFNSI